MSDTTLTLNRHIKASPANIWRCWTEPELLKKWFAPKPVETTTVEMDPRPGGRFRTVMQVPEHGEMSDGPGCILVAERNQRLVWTNCLGPDFVPRILGTGSMDFGFSVDIRLSPEDGGCRYDVVVRHATAEQAKAHADMGFEVGWGTATDQLEALAAAL